ncbi:sulfite exporter TauE/SafE family protein [Virgibacillus doumboii]|uniref:sulfite exporter TauE/SafE family protein n=1 Tax=Virgibacillus doumboii TaxID=2697503 RepID=UPI0013DF23A5|nr:sulfite exporter TauE/SafE family protein [Virgibacillus doumboii]
MEVSYALLLLSLGILSGCYGTIVGAGGGFIFVPALLLILNMEPALAAGSGLFIVLINSLAGIAGYARQGKIKFRLGLKIAIGAFPGALIGVWLLQRYSSQTFFIIFATTLLILGLFLLIKSRPNSDTRSSSYNEVSSTVDTTGNTKWILLLGLFMGTLSSYLGIGGGWLLVPVLIYMFKVPTHLATATSIFSLCLYSTVGVVTQLIYNHIDWMTVLWGGIGVILGAQLGVILSQKIPGKIIIQMLSLLLIVIGIRMYFQ